MKQVESPLSETHQSALVIQLQLQPGALLWITTSRNTVLTEKSLFHVCKVWGRLCGNYCLTKTSRINPKVARAESTSPG